LECHGADDMPGLKTDQGGFSLVNYLNGYRSRVRVIIFIKESIRSIIIVNILDINNLKRN